MGDQSLDRKIIIPTYESFLDGLRGVAILMVLAFHTVFFVPGKPSSDTFQITIEHLSRGVQFFFIISAFTLFQSFQKRQHEDRKPFVSFYLRRCFRILPLWWLALAMYYFFGGPQHSISDLLANAFFYFGFLPDAWKISIIPGGWSLFVEESFYLFFPLWFFLIKNFLHAFILTVLSYIVAGLWYSYGHFLIPNMGENFKAIFPLGNYFAFFIGISLFYLRKDLLQSFLKNELTFLNRLLLDVLAFVCFVGLFFCDRVLGSLFLAPIIVSSFFSKTLVGKLTRSSLLMKFGTCCYSIYLFHSLWAQHIYFLQSYYFNVLGIIDSSQEVQTFFWFFPFVSISLICGLLSYHYIERPCINVGKYIIHKVKC